MKNFFRTVTASICALVLSASAFAQSKVTATLVEANGGDPIGFATVSLTKKGATKPTKYTLSNDAGVVSIEGVKDGAYTFKAELMGYVPFEMEITLPKEASLGKIEMKTDRQQLEAASVSAVGNPVVIKKDTIEYNATSFKTTDNDVLEDLLKKLPGVEVDESGGITVNGQSISKITIDGKTFFLDDPTVASKNIPAKIINKLKVIEKKSDQAEFTGIDDGEEEHVIDLSIKPGMMKGAFGNIMGGAGHDIPSTDVIGDYRFQGAGFLGKFTDKTQLSVVLNANNTNNRGFNDLAGSMMGNQRGGGGGMGGGRGGNRGDNGVTTSYMAGVNGASSFFDGKMDLSGNYMYSNTSKDVEQSTLRRTHLEGQDLVVNSPDGISHTGTSGNRLGFRLEHKFSDNTSIIFEPQINFGGGNYYEKSSSTTDTDLLNGTVNHTNESTSDNGGDNRNWDASGFFLLRQRLGIPGRTLTAMARYEFSNNQTNGYNISNVYTNYDSDSGKWGDVTAVNQTVDQVAKTSSLFGRVTFTEPLGNHFYVEANYGFRWNHTTSEKDTYDENNGHTLDVTYSNNILNESYNHSFGGNVLYQRDKARAQVGFSANPTKTHNETTRNGVLQTYDDSRWKFAPQAMVWWDVNDNTNVRLFYHGSSEQPSTSQLMPVPDNTDPLNIGFGNPSLAPYFSHDLHSEFRVSNKKSFASLNIRLDGGFTQDPIVSALWYDNSGVQYTMPFNGPASGNASLNMFANVPIAKSNFSVGDMTRVSWNKSSSYVGNSIPIENYYDNGELDYTTFLADYSKNKDSWFSEANTNTMSVVERLRFRYRSDALELGLSGRTRMNQSWYRINETTSTTRTFNNQLQATANWTWELTGLTVKSEFNYNWYNGYTTDQPSEYILNAELQKLLFKNKLTLALKGYDILGQAKNLSVTDSNNYHSEVVNNTLGRYIILSLTYRFGNFDKSKMRGPGGPGGPGGPRPGGPGPR